MLITSNDTLFLGNFHTVPYAFFFLTCPKGERSVSHLSEMNTAESPQCLTQKQTQCKHTLKETSLQTYFVELGGEDQNKHAEVQNKN